MAVWDFHGQIVVITGGTGGIGLALSKEFLNSGAKVYLCGLNDNKFESAKHELTDQFGGPDRSGSPDQISSRRFHLQPVDMRNVSELREWLQGIADHEQRIDVLVNAAGLCDTAHASEVDELLWDRILDVNLKGTFFASQFAAEVMKQRRYGRIINISSISAYNGGILVSPPYSASKAGILALTKSFASLYSQYGICVNAVTPGPTDTEMITSFTSDGLAAMIAKTPNGRIGKTEDIVQSILFLSDESSKHITGAALDINGGLYMR